MIELTYVEVLKLSDKEDGTGANVIVCSSPWHQVHLRIEFNLQISF